MLAKTVAPSHPAPDNFLTEIKKVYDWLQENLEDARDRLQQLSAEPIWLNSSDGLEDISTWVPATKLVFGALRDGNGPYRTREFLEPYRRLVTSVGASQVTFPELPSADEERMRHPDWVMLQFKEFQANRRLCDIRFEVEKKEVFAHRIILAFVAPHFGQAPVEDLAGGLTSRERPNTPSYPLPKDTMIFSVQSVVGESKDALIYLRDP